MSKKSGTHWTTPADIAAAAEKLWDSGKLPRALLAGDDLFPYFIKIRGPTSEEMAQRFGEVREWIAELEARAKTERRPSYTLEWRRVRHRVMGEQSIPEKAVLQTGGDALALARKTEDAKRLLYIKEETCARLPSLEGFVLEKPLAALKHAESWPRLLAVCEWLLAHPRPSLYIREIDAPAVHTKFVEVNKKILGELLDIILPEGAIDDRFSCADFESRYGFRQKPPLVRLRLPLGCPFFPQGVSDISLAAPEFAGLEIPCERALIIENEITFLAVPRASGLLLVWGKGFAVDALKNAEWLKDIPLFYWGDIDTHGFAILSELRSSFPRARSVLMDAETLAAHRALCVDEPVPAKYIPERLTSEERAVFESLLVHDGRALRLEQERVGMSFAMGKLRQSAALPTAE